MELSVSEALDFDPTRNQESDVLPAEPSGHPYQRDFEEDPWCLRSGWYIWDACYFYRLLHFYWWLIVQVLSSV